MAQQEYKFANMLIKIVNFVKQIHLKNKFYAALNIVMLIIIINL